MIQCICLDSKNRPEEIPMGKWISEKMKYHITHVWFHPAQGIQGCSLHEVRLGKESEPYSTFRLSRFGVTLENLEKLIEMMNACSDLNLLDITALIRESELEIIENYEL